MELHNCMEDVVKRIVTEIIERYSDICKCEKCRLDIEAIALNNLSPQYTVTDKGKLFTKVNEMEAQYKVNIVREVTLAIEVVYNQPHHNVE